MEENIQKNAVENLLDLGEIDINLYQNDKELLSAWGQEKLVEEQKQQNKKFDSLSPGKRLKYKQNQQQNREITKNSSMEISEDWQNSKEYLKSQILLNKKHKNGKFLEYKRNSEFSGDQHNKIKPFYYYNWDYEQEQDNKDRNINTYSSNLFQARSQTQALMFQNNNKMITNESQGSLQNSDYLEGYQINNKFKSYKKNSVQEKNNYDYDYFQKRLTFSNFNQNLDQRRNNSVEKSRSVLNNSKQNENEFNQTSTQYQNYSKQRKLSYHPKSQNSKNNQENNSFSELKNQALTKNYQQLKEGIKVKKILYLQLKDKIKQNISSQISKNQTSENFFKILQENRKNSLNIQRNSNSNKTQYNKINLKNSQQINLRNSLCISNQTKTSKQLSKSQEDLPQNKQVIIQQKNKTATKSNDLKKTIPDFQNKPQQKLFFVNMLAREDQMYQFKSMLLQNFSINNQFQQKQPYIASTISHNQNHQKPFYNGIYHHNPNN